MCLSPCNHNFQPNVSQEIKKWPPLVFKFILFLFLYYGQFIVTRKSDIVKRNVHRGVHNLFKDIEISRSDIELLSAISFGITCLIIVNLFFAFGNPYFNEFSTGNYLIIGLVVGIIIGPIVADHFTRKFPVINCLFWEFAQFSIYGPILIKALSMPCLRRSC